MLVHQRVKHLNFQCWGWNLKKSLGCARKCAKQVGRGGFSPGGSPTVEAPLILGVFDFWLKPKNPLVNVDVTMERSTMLSMNPLYINGPFSTSQTVTVITRGFLGLLQRSLEVNGHYCWWLQNPAPPAWMVETLEIMGCLPPFSTGDNRISLAPPPFSDHGFRTTVFRWSCWLSGCVIKWTLAVERATPLLLGCDLCEDRHGAATLWRGHSAGWYLEIFPGSVLRMG